MAVYSSSLELYSASGSGGIESKRGVGGLEKPSHGDDEVEEASESVI